MLTIKYGDLFANVKENAIIVHGCNAQGKMNSGFAKIVRDKYPGAYKAYMDAYKDGGLDTGEVVTYHSVEDGIRIFNAITQEYYGYDGKKYVDYNAVDWTMKITAHYAKLLGLPVHLPYIGTERGGGSKEHLLNSFQHAFQDVDATLWILKENK